MDKFLVLYRAPNSVIDEWMKKPEQERKPEETKMMEAWKKWMSANGSKLTDKGAGAGKPKVVSSSGVKDARNDIMMYQIVQANSADEAAKMFVDHPHFGIPQATIDPVRVSSRSQTTIFRLTGRSPSGAAFRSRPG
jgi:hypothetical protein